MSARKITPAPTGEYTDVIAVELNAGGDLFYSAITDKGLRRERVAELMRKIPNPGASKKIVASAVTSWILGLRSMTMWRFAQAARAAGFEPRAVLVPLDEQGHPLPTQGEVDGQAVADVLAVVSTAALHGDREVSVEALTAALGHDRVTAALDAKKAEQRNRRTGGRQAGPNGE